MLHERQLCAPSRTVPRTWKYSLVRALRPLVLGTETTLRPHPAILVGLGAIASDLALKRVYGSNTVVHWALVVSMCAFACWFTTVAIAHLLKSVILKVTQLLVVALSAMLTWRLALRRFWIGWRKPEEIANLDCLCPSKKKFRNCCGKP